MAFNIKFYKISDAPNVLNKKVNTEAGNVGTVTGYNCTPWEPVGVLDGSVVIGYVQDIGTANYAYISGGTRPRYAYVTGYEDLPGNQMRVYVKEDALMTFNSKIQTSPILATRSSCVAKDGGNVGYNSFLDDKMWRCDATNLYWLSEDMYKGYFDYTDRNSQGAMTDQFFYIATAG